MSSKKSVSTLGILSILILTKKNTGAKTTNQWPPTNNLTILILLVYALHVQITTIAVVQVIEVVHIVMQLDHH